MEMLSTGMADLDGQFKEKGLLPGSVVTVKSEPLSVGEVLCYNLFAGRQTEFYSLGQIANSTKELAEDAGGLEPDSVTYHHVQPTSPFDDLSLLDADSGLSESVNIFIGPINLIEKHSSEAEYWDILTELKSAVEEVNGICILLAIESENNPDLRWLTYHHSDHVFTVLHKMKNSGVDTHFILEKVHPRQSLATDDNRAFYLTEGVNMEIDTSRNIQA